MKTFQVKVYKRQLWQSNNSYSYTFNLAGGWIDSTEYEYVEADYYSTADCILDFIRSEDGEAVATYHPNQWLSVKQLVNEENPAPDNNEGITIDASST